MEELEGQGAIESPSPLGAFGLDEQFIPRRTAAKDPTLLNFLGLGGEQNRRKLAETFLRPTTWGDYCELVSPNKCQEEEEGNNGTAAIRPPQDETESGKYYVEGLYSGHFRATNENDCDANPTNCTGHLIDYPCSWNANTRQKLYHLDIALEPFPTSYGETLQIVAAAHANKADIMMVWWTPEPLHEEYYDTDSELIPIVYPPPTQECMDGHTTREHRCNADILVEAGSPEGACGEPPQMLQKAMSTTVQQSSQNPSTPEALWSPAYEALLKYQLTELQMNQIFKYWLERDTDKWNNDLRYATCRWAAENIDLVESFIPQTYPRVIAEEDNISESPGYIVALAVSLLAVLVTLAAGVAIYHRRNKKVMFHAQVEVLSCVVFGLLVVAVGSTLSAFPPTDGLCVGSTWLINAGFAIELMPLLFKVDAINHSIGTDRMKRVRINPRQLQQSLALAALTVGTLLVAWTVLDAPERAVKYEITSDTNDAGETIVETYHTCESESAVWESLSFAWRAAVLLYSLVIAIMASRVKDDLNGAKTFATLFLAHILFLAFRAAFYFLSAGYEAQQLQSIFLGIDCIVAVTFFVGPKLWEKSEDQDSDEPLPDLFINTTIMFADMAGFTKWSSMREPVQVFRFLETVFAKFDELGESRRIFKVESVADCYVAAAGIPHARQDHAVAMAKFAIDCMNGLHRLAHELEIIYGPDTAELDLRIGLHSGAVTGGFLKGKGARFQLFGETMNIAARMESTSKKGKIQLSDATAALLNKAGKFRWIEKRDDLINAKGLGTMQTHWLTHGTSSTENNRTASEDMLSILSGSEADLYEISKTANRTQRERLIGWNVETLHAALKDIVAQKIAVEKKRSSRFSLIDLESLGRESLASNLDSSNASLVSRGAKPPGASSSKLPLEDVQEIIEMPMFDGRKAMGLRDSEREKVEIPEDVLKQLHSLVSTIAGLYHDNDFHNFAHASHVVMSVKKHMNRIIAPADLDLNKSNSDLFGGSTATKKTAAILDERTYGIATDPLTQFACLFSALIHDLDHPGVPNTQLIVENKDLGDKYKGRSVAEQNSLDLSWDLLMREEYGALRGTICETDAELERFRRLVVNAVMATDIADKQLKELRNTRWDKAFKLGDHKEHADANPRDTKNRKATIVIEHLIQASDIAHTMQHWHVYRQWNENLFREMYKAYKVGRSAKNPAEFWYDGEIGFFDFYIIPLSKKLRDCGVFGISSDENLSYALANRAEWVARGKEVVASMLEELELDASNGSALQADFPPDIEVGIMEDKEETGDTEVSAEASQRS